MTRSISSLIVLGALALGFGCQSTAVGDPCEPEQIPPMGFNGAEAYIEASSVQCRTRVCMVYKLQGDPSDDCDAQTTTCVDEDDAAAKIYCTCRCDKPEGVPGSICECPSGFECTEILQSGGVGLVGSYCVRSDDPDLPQPEGEQEG